MQTRKAIVVLGSINADLVAKVPRIPRPGETVLASDFKVHPGGKGANQAVAVARLGYPVIMIGKVGTDTFGDLLKSSLVSDGVDTQAVGSTNGVSGVALIQVGSNGENSIAVAPGANSAVLPKDVDVNLSLIRSAGIVLLQLETPLETIEYTIDVCAREGVPVILDPAPARELPQTLLKKVTWFTPNETEANFYFDGVSAPMADSQQLSRAFHRLDMPGLVLKRGAQGVHLTLRDGTSMDIPALPVKAIDTTAAGDAFNGAFATGLMLGRGPVESARFASAAAAISVTREGAQPSMASFEETQSLLGQSR